ncbi:MAG: putative peptidoglycan glycosyltransferase FtsW [Pseudomonadota bacterium]
MTGVASALFARSDASWITEWRRTLDWSLLACGLGLLGLGLLLSLAAGPVAADRMGLSNAYEFVIRQAIFASVALVVLTGTSLLSRDWVRRVSAAILIGALCLMVVILMVGHEAKGAQRWLRIAGLSLQPSEFVKPALVVMAAWLLAQRSLFPKGPWIQVSIGLFGFTMLLLMLQPDVGQSVLLSAAFLTVFFVSGLPLRLAAGFAAGGAVLAGVLYAAMPHVRFRVNSFFNPTGYDTYQIDKAHEAIARGGLLGAGPGEGTVKSALPDAHTDFIYAVLAEEYGLVAALALISVYAFITLRGVLLGARIGNPYPRAAAVGLFTLFGLQAAINIGVNIGLLPPKGMTLPFLSYGGSSLIGSALTLGLALALIRGRGQFRSGYG